MSVPEPEKRNVELGPFFLAGVVLFAYGVVRRSVFGAAAGLGAIWLDQRTELGRSLKERARAKYMTVQDVQDEGEETRGAGLDVEEPDRPTGHADPRRDVDA